MTDDSKEPDVKTDPGKASASDASTTSGGAAEPPAASTAPAVGTSIGTEKFRTTMQPFADSIGVELSQMASVLEEQLGEPGDDFVEMIMDPSIVDDDAIAAALTKGGAKEAKVKLALKKLRQGGASAASSTAPAGANGAPAGLATVATSLLPPVPSDESLLEALKVGGEPKFDVTTLQAAIRWMTARSLGVEDRIEKTVLDAIEARAIDMDQPVGGPIFGRVQKLVTRQRYADVLSAMDLQGGGKLVSEARKNALLGRSAELFGYLKAFLEQLQSYKAEVMAQYQGPQLMGIFAASLSGGSAAASALQPLPDPSVILSELDALFDNLNRVFSGTGVIVARAMGADVIETRNILKDPELISAVGAGNRDEMLKVLGINTTASDVNMERNVLQFATATMYMKSISTEQLPTYIITLATIGERIPWDKLTTGVTGRGRRTRERAGQFSDVEV